MMVSKVLAGSVLAAGLGAGAFLGAGTALAGPGVSFDNGSGGQNTIGFGDRSAATGATANASEGNRALAVNITSKTGTQAIAQGHNNNVVSIDGVATTGPHTKNNNVVNAFGVTSVDGKAENNNVLTVGGFSSVNGKRDNVVTVAGATVTDKYSHDNTIINAGGIVGSTGQREDAPGALSCRCAAPRSVPRLTTSRSPTSASAAMRRKTSPRVLCGWASTGKLPHTG